MKSLKSFRPSAPLVINLIALSIVLGGQAIALPGKGKVKRDDIAKGAVTTRALAKGAVKRTKIARAAVTSGKLAKGAVLGRSIAPRSVSSLSFGGAVALKTETAPIPNTDASPGCCEWTASPPVSVTCPAGALLLSGGVAIESSSTQRSFIRTSAPSNTPSAPGTDWIGRINADDGGTALASAHALCLP